MSGNTYSHWVFKLHDSENEVANNDNIYNVVNCL